MSQRTGEDEIDSTAEAGTAQCYQGVQHEGIQIICAERAAERGIAGRFKLLATAFRNMTSDNFLYEEIWGKLSTGERKA